MKESAYAYKAFISHRMEGEGRNVSERLARFLKTFRTPRKLLKMRKHEQEENPALKDFPKQLGEIYYSVRSGVPSALFVDMPAKLQETEYLIVICTQDYAHPTGKWCYADIAAAAFLGYPVSESERHGIPEHDMERLAKLAKSDPQKRERLRHIIPVIVRDARKVSKAEDCLPPFLALLGNIGPDTAISKENEVFCDVAAKLLGPEVDKNKVYDLWAKEERIDSLMNIFMGIAFAIPVIWFTVADYLRTHSFEKYYTDYVECFNEPKGLNPVSEEQLRHLNNAYLITERNSRTIRLEHCTFGHFYTHFATIIGRETVPPVCKIEYSDDTLRITKHQCFMYDGYLAQERHFMGPRGEDVQLYSIKPTAAGDRWTIVPDSLLYFEAAATKLQDSRRKSTKVLRMSRVLDKEKGYVLLERFRNYNDEVAVRNEMGIFGHRYQRDAEGRVTCCTFLDDFDNPMPDFYGAVTCEYTYFSPPEGPRGSVKSIAYYGENHELVRHHKGWAMVQYQYDSYGNLASEKYFSPQGKPYPNDEGVTEIKYEYDKGRLIYEGYYDAQGHLCENKNGLAYAKLNYSEIQNKTTIRYYDSFRVPVMHDGAFGNECTTDEQGRPISFRYSDEEGRPCLRKGIAAIHINYEANGKKITISFSGLDGKPCCHEKGHAKVITTHDQKGNVTSICFFDLNNKPYLIDGRAKEMREYDPKGNCTSVSFYNEEDKPCKAEGYAKEVREFDDDGHLTAIQYFDETGAPCLLYGVAKFVMKYDPSGHETSRRYLGPDNTPCLHENGTAGSDFTYDAMGNMLSQCFVGVDGKPTLHKEGIARQEYSYDANYRLESVSNFDLEGKPCLCQSGYAKAEYTRDENGNVIEDKYFDTDGQTLEQHVPQAKAGTTTDKSIPR